MGILVESMPIYSKMQTVLSHATKYEMLVALGLFLFIWMVVFNICEAAIARYPSVPIVGKAQGILFPIWRARMRYILRGVDVIKEGHGKYKDTIFQIPTVNQDLLVLPTKYIEELKSLPETTMSSSHAVADYFLGSYTTLQIQLFGHVVWDVTRGQLTRNSAKHVDPLVDEAEFGFLQELPLCEGPDWTHVSVHPTFLQIVGRTSARIFVGQPLCRNRLWLETSIDFARCVFLGSSFLKVVPAAVRPIVGLFSPHMWRIRRHHKNARSLLIPEITRRREEFRLNSEAGFKKPNDMLQWLEDASQGDDARPERIVDRQLGLSFAAIHTTTNHLVNVIYDLAARWNEYGPELRAEIEEVLAASQGVWKKSTLTKLSKLDSFSKESQRMNPPSALSFNRKVQRPYTIPSSSPPYTLRKGSYVAVAAGPILASEDVYSEPEVFDGFRFHRMRSEPEAEQHNHQFVSTALDSMTFGHGRYACPGRFFASNESKIILAILILNYDIRFGTEAKEGRPMGVDIRERPNNRFFADACFPDPNVKIWFRKRKG